MPAGCIHVVLSERDLGGDVMCKTGIRPKCIVAQAVLAQMYSILAILILAFLYTKLLVLWQKNGVENRKGQGYYSILLPLAILRSVQKKRAAFQCVVIIRLFLIKVDLIIKFRLKQISRKREHGLLPYPPSKWKQCRLKLCTALNLTFFQIENFNLANLMSHTVGIKVPVAFWWHFHGLSLTSYRNCEVVSWKVVWYTSLRLYRYYMRMKGNVSAARNESFSSWVCLLTRYTEYSYCLQG